MRVASPAEIAAELAESHARAQYFTAADELDQSRHSLVAASLTGMDAEERLRRRSAMHDATLSYWAALETYTRARAELDRVDRIRLEHRTEVR